MSAELRSDPAELRSDPAELRARLGPYLAAAREQVITAIREMVPARRRHDGGLWDLVLDYPLREAKAMRPALCLAACRAFGGGGDAVIRTAAALELYHNAFLVHDDIEDGSELRRHAPTLHRMHGVPIAINVGDGMLALALQPLLQNMATIGLGRALRTLEVVAAMSRETAEGQMLELGWIRANDRSQRDIDYCRMVVKKTGWYSFITPLLVGAIAVGADHAHRRRLWSIGLTLGIAFQIQDDLLNLTGDPAVTGKESDGDLWEGKHTLVLQHALGRSSAADRARAVEALGKVRPTGDEPQVGARTGEDVRFLRDLVDGTGALGSARVVALDHAARALRGIDALERQIGASPHLDFIRALAEYAVLRDR